MNLKSRLVKLEASALLGKPLFEMEPEEREQFVRKHLGLPEGTAVTDDMVEEVFLSGVAPSRLTHEEALDILGAREKAKTAEACA